MEEELFRRCSRVEEDQVLMGLRELYRRRLHMDCYPSPGPSPSPSHRP
ncbi:hypothetical protein DFAR_3360019 [Desulfarculales bacterium]